MRESTAGVIPGQREAGTVADEYDGPTLRSVRESVRVPLRRVARLAGMSHGHLSKVERGEHGRPVTPAILNAYEKATGMRLAGAKVVGRGEDPAGVEWRRGRLSDARRRGFNAQIAAVAVGGPAGEPIGRLIDSTGRTRVPSHVEEGDVAQLEQFARRITAEDLRWGGGLVALWGRVTLRWWVGLTTATMTEETHSRLHTAICHLAHRAAWAAFDADAHDAARNLFTVALDAAYHCRDRDLRAHVVADVAAQHNHLGYPGDALEIAGIVEGDQRISPAVRMAVYAVKARAHAAAGEAPECRRHLRLVDECHAAALAGPPPGWQASLLAPGHRDALTGQAAALLARRTNSTEDWEYAVERLTGAVQTLDPGARARARALCAAQLATLHLAADDHPAGLACARQALAAAGQVRSARLRRYLATIQTTADSHHDNPEIKQLAADLKALAGHAPHPPAGSRDYRSDYGKALTTT